MNHQPLCLKCTINVYLLTYLITYVAGWVKEWEAEADWQQDGVCSARLCTWPWSGLWEHSRCVPRG